MFAFWFNYRPVNMFLSLVRVQGQTAILIRRRVQGRQPVQRVLPFLLTGVVQGSFNNGQFIRYTRRAKELQFVIFNLAFHFVTHKGRQVLVHRWEKTRQMKSIVINQTLFCSSSRSALHRILESD